MAELRRRLFRVRRRVARHRRPLAAVLAGITVLALVRTFAPPPPPTTPALVATRALAAGSAVAAGDVRVVELPSDAVPASALQSERDVVGRTVVGPVDTDEMITGVRLVGRRWVAGFGSDRVAAPVRMADAEAVSLLQVGDRIDVYAPTSTGATASTVVRAALVATLPDPGPDISRSEGALVGVAVTSDDATRLAQEAARAPLSFGVLG